MSMEGATCGGACMARDRIHIHDLRLGCVLGVHEHERKAKREVIVHLTLETDLARAGTTDDLADTVDYDALVARVTRYVEGSEFHLLERLAEGVATACLVEARVERVQVTIEKPGAVPAARCAAVEIARERVTGS